MSTKNISFSFLIFLVPFFLFLRPSNLEYLDFKTSSQIFFSQIFLFIIVTLCYFLIILVLRKRISDFLFLPLISTLYYINFLYYDLKKFIGDNDQTLSDDVLKILFFLICIIFFLFIKFTDKINKFAFIYSVILIFFSVSKFINLNTFNFGNFETKNFETEHKQESEKNLEKFDNVYFIIFDGMMSLEVFEKNFNLNTANLTDNLLEDIIYIKKSHSNYNSSQLSIGSMFNLNYLNKKSNNSYSKKDLYPHSLWNKSLKNISLLNILYNKGINFYWLSSSMMPCRTRYFIKCSLSGANDEFSSLKRNLFLFYSSTFYADFTNNDLIKSEVRLPINEILSRKNFGQNNFFFIHNILPHRPYNFSEDCEMIENGSYQKSFFCAVSLIKKTIVHLNKYDPNSLIVVTADHGAHIPLLRDELISYNLKYDYDPKISTYLKLKDNCLIPQDILKKHNLSYLQLTLNCNYNLNLELSDFKFFAFENTRIE